MSNRHDFVPYLGAGYPAVILQGASNFADWKQSVEASMVQSQVYYVLGGVVPTRRREVSPEMIPLPPPLGGTIGTSQVTDASEADRYNVWGFLKRTISGQVLIEIHEDAKDPELADARHLWRELHRLFDHTDGQTAARLMKALWRSDLEEGGNAQRHLHRFQVIQGRLAHAGEAFSDRIFAYAIIQSLPSSYSNVASNLFQKENLRSQSAISAIMTEWRRKKSPGIDVADQTQIAEEDNSPSTALVANGGRDTRRPARTNTNRERESKSLKCPEHPNSNSHDAEHCTVLLRKKIKELEAKSGRSSTTGAVAQKLEDETYDDIHGLVTISSPVALVGTAVGTSIYTIASGASHHMVCTTDNLSQLKEISGQTIRTGGNGLVEVTHSGLLKLGPFLLQDVRTRFQPALRVPARSRRLLDSLCRRDLRHFRTEWKSTCANRREWPVRDQCTRDVNIARRANHAHTGYSVLTQKSGSPELARPMEVSQEWTTRRTVDQHPAFQTVGCLMRAMPFGQGPPVAIAALVRSGDPTKRNRARRPMGTGTVSFHRR